MFAEFSAADYSFFADLVVFVHLIYIGCVLLGQVLIVGGILCGWQWVRSMWFRIGHLTMILIVATEAIIGMECPLTVWEDQLRDLAGDEFDGSFIGQVMHELVYQLPDSAEVKLASYIGFFVVVLATFVFWPPRRRKHITAPTKAVNSAASAPPPSPVPEPLQSR